MITTYFWLFDAPVCASDVKLNSTGSPIQFLCVTLKNWKDPGDEASIKVTCNALQ